LMKKMRRVLRVRLFVLCAIVLAAPLAASAQEQFTEWVEMPDGVLLATEVYLPEGDGPWPVVLVRTPYGRMFTGQIHVGPPSLYTEDGYAHVAQDARGTGGSGGVWDYAEDPLDGRTTVDWITDQWWCDGNIEMGGMSAGGIVTYALAPGAPAAVKALRPEAATSDHGHQSWYQGGAFRWSLTGRWMTDMGFEDQLEEILQHRLRDEFWEPYQWIDHAAEVNTPMLHIGGWYDIYSQAAFDGFQTFQHQGGDGARGNQFLIVGPWTHMDWGVSEQPGLTYPDNATLDLDAVRAAFRDYWLKGEPTGVDQWPPVQVYLMGAVAEDEPNAPGNRWVELDDWPPWSYVKPWYLDANGGLADTPAPYGAITLTMDPDHAVPTRGGGNAFTARGPQLQYTAEDRDDVLTFTSEVLDQPVAIMGPVTARIWIRPDTPDLDLSVRLCDVYPQGQNFVEQSRIVIDGIQRARMRCGDDHECFLEPGVATEIEVDLWSTAIVFNAGHRIRVSIAGSNSPRFEVNPNHGGDLNGDDEPVIAYPEILFGPDHPSRILLPVIKLNDIKVRGTPGENPVAEPSSE